MMTEAQAEKSFLDRMIDAIAEKVNGLATAEEQAKATHDVLRQFCEEYGQTPDIEVGLYEPGKAPYCDNSNCWVACWEAGPHEWGIIASCSSRIKVFCEPYYSFDLCFYPAEDKR